MEITAYASGSSGNLYAVTDGVTPLLLDAGLPWKRMQQALCFGVSRYAGCLVTHEHGDHSRAVADLLRAGVDCYMTQGTAEALGVAAHHRVHIVRPLVQFSIGTWTVLPFDTVHDAAEPAGFLLAGGGCKVLYLTDTAYCRYRFRGLTHVMVEANYSLDILNANVAAGKVSVEMKRRLLKTHMSLETCLDFLAANDLGRVEELWLIHLSDGNSNADRFKLEVMATTGRPVFVAG